MYKFRLILSIILFFFSTNLVSWGFWGHQRINRNAVFSLPPELFHFYRSHIDYITSHAVDPDKRRYSDPEEAPRHYMDIDRYTANIPFDSLVMTWKRAVAIYGEDTLKAHGIVPWHIQVIYYRLVNAFKEKDEKRILRLSAEIGHYIGDAHVPLHCSSNYNGQKTGQHGIHGFWESRIPELFGNDFDYLTGNCEYIPNVHDYTWNIIRESYAAHDSVLKFERDLNAIFPSDKKYTYEVKGNQQIKVYSKEYTESYNKLLDGMVERRMRAAIIAVASYWYSAWVDAGMPKTIEGESESGKEELPADSIPIIRPEIQGHED